MDFLLASQTWMDEFLCRCTNASMAGWLDQPSCHRVELTYLLPLLLLLLSSTAFTGFASLLLGAARPVSVGRSSLGKRSVGSVVIKWSLASAPSSLRWEALGQKDAGDFSSDLFRRVFLETEPVENWNISDFSNSSAKWCLWCCESKFLDTYHCLKRSKLGSIYPRYMWGYHNAACSHAVQELETRLPGWK